MSSRASAHTNNMAAYNITFNGYSLQNSSFRTRIIQHTNIPSKLIQAEARARADGLTVVNVRYSSRQIEVEGLLTAATRQAAVDLIDAMKLNLNGASGTLLIDYGGSQRMYIATVDSLELPEDFFNISSIPYKVSFYCADPFGYATTSGNLSFSAITAMLNDTLITLSGSIDADPVVQLTLTTAVGMSLLTVSNENTGEVIIVSKPGGNFSNGDVVTLDTRRKLAQINGSGIDYTGRFPTLRADGTVQRLRVAIQATNVSYSEIITYSPRYL